MKKFLRWLFADKWEEFCEEMKEADFHHRNLAERNFVAEIYLKHLGYEMIWNDPFHQIEDDEIPLPAESYGWKLKKVPPQE